MIADIFRGFACWGLILASIVFWVWLLVPLHPMGRYAVSIGGGALLLGFVVGMGFLVAIGSGTK